jgi:hypothetical protein
VTIGTTQQPVEVAAVRRKIESWLREDGPHTAIALRGCPEWPGDPVLAVNDTLVRVVPCPTPLAARAALHDRSDAESLVLLTELTDTELGDGVLAHVSRCTVRSVDTWDLVRQMFGVETLDPTLADRRRGGGAWLAATLTDLAPPDGWPPPAGAVLTRDHALSCLTGEVLGLDRDRLDSAGLLEWSTEAPAVLRFTRQPAAVVDGIAAYLVEIVGPAGAPIMAAVRAGHGADAIPLGLVVSALWSAPARPVSTELAVARTRLEPSFGGVALTDRQAAALATAAEAWVDRALDSEHSGDVQRMLLRADVLAASIGAAALLGTSDLLPAGLNRRLRDFAAAVRPAREVTADSVATAQRAAAAVERHRFATSTQAETARMAVRLLRWLSLPDSPPPATLLDALHRQVRQDAWVDRARLDIFAGVTDPELADTYAALYRAVDERRRIHDEQFATLLAAATAANAEPGSLLRVEDVLERVVRPILANGRRVLVVVLDGMSTAAATELAESILRSGPWLELTPDGGPRTGVLAALPTVTEVSRCSLLSGHIAVGQQKAELEALSARFPGSLLLHKAKLRAGAGSAFDPEVTVAVQDPFTSLVVAVVNTIDDSLDRGDPDTVVWTTESATSVRDLLALAQDRVVVLVSDHGHVVDRGPQRVNRPSPAHENRWRPADPPAGDGEILVRGDRVALGGGAVVLPWREDVQYGPRKAGYHGGASPAEAVIPLIVLSAGVEDAVPGWAPAPVASPTWWRAPATGPTESEPPRPRVAPRRRPNGPDPLAAALFDVEPLAVEVVAQASGRPALVDALLASEIYRQRRGAGGRALPDDRVAAMLSVLLAGGGRATMETLAADAGVPAHRMTGTITALRRVLQVEGYPVVEVDPDGQTVKLDTGLLAQQFGLDRS